MCVIRGVWRTQESGPGANSRMRIAGEDALDRLKALEMLLVGVFGAHKSRE